MEVSHGPSKPQTDFESRLTWQTDYRYGRYVLIAKDGKVDPTVLITGCKSKDISSSKMISISTATKGTWTVTIPNELSPLNFNVRPLMIIPMVKISTT